MIKATFFRNNRGEISGFEISGHAGYAEEGSDIICAAVSAIAYTAIGYFHEKQYDGKLPVYSERDGFLKFEAPRPSTDRAEERAAAAAVLEAARIGLMQIAQSYGTEYIRVID